MSHSNKCILANLCRERDTNTCSSLCPHYLSLHGKNGDGGRIESASIPSDYRFNTVTSNPARNSPIKMGDKQETAGAFSERYVTTFRRQFEDGSERIKSLYLYSPQTGNGKTTTACAIANTYMISHYIGSLSRGLSPLDRPVYFLSMNELQKWHNRAFSPGSQDTRDKAGDEVARRLDIARVVPFLVVDDLGVRKATAAFISIIYDLLDNRTTEGLPSIFTTNLPLAELKELFREEDPQGKVVDRIRDMCVFIEFNGGSQRGHRKGGS